MKKHQGRITVYEVQPKEFNLTSKKSQLVFIEGEKHIFNLIEDCLKDAIEKGNMKKYQTFASYGIKGWGDVSSLTKILARRNILLKVLAYDLNNKEFKLIAPKTMRLLDKKTHSNPRANKYNRGRFNNSDLIPVGLYTYKRKDGEKSSRVGGKRKVLKIASERRNIFNL